MGATDDAAQVQPPQDDRPSLRQDIADELADHLECALRRELLETKDETSARQRVFDKFGDPRQIARKLWWQAQWSKMMSHRAALGVTCFLAVACAVMLGLTGWLFRQQQASALEQQRLMAEMMERVARMAEAQRATEAQLAKTRAQAAAPVEPTLKFKLTLDTPDGPPAGKYWIELTRLGFEKDNKTSERADDQGIVDFGYSDPGRYEATVRTSWGYVGPTRRFVLHPGATHEERFVCPSKPAEAQVAFSAKLPEDLQQEGVYALVHFGPGALTFDDQEWKDLYKREPVVYLGANRWELHNHIPQETRSSSNRGSPFAGPQRDSQKPRWIVYLHKGEKGLVLPDVPMTCKAGVPHSVGVRLIRRIPLREAAPGSNQRLQFDVLGHPVPPSSQPVVRHEQIAPPPNLKSGSSQEPQLYQLPDGFVAETAGPKTWEVPIPEELIAQARSYIEANPWPSEVARKSE